MKTIELKSTQVTYYTLDIPDEEYTEVWNLLGRPTYGSREVVTDVIKRHPRPFLTREFFSEELHSLFDCDVSDEVYELVVEEMEIEEVA